MQRSKTDCGSQQRSAFFAFLMGLIVATTNAAIAADANGDFALEGAGQAKCSRFIESMESDSTEVLIFGGWMHGYLTGVNRYEPGTYDVATWPSQQQQLQFLLGVCKRNVNARFFEAVATMVEQLRADKLTEKETPVYVGQLADGSRLTLYPSTIKRIRKRLNELVLADFSAPLAGVWDKGLGDAMRAYQESAGLPVTGLPDPGTLLRLFRE